MNNVYTKRGINFKFIAEPYGNQNPIIDIYFTNSNNKKILLAENIQIISTDPDSPDIVSVYPVAKKGEHYITIVYKNDFRDNLGERAVILTGVDLNHNLDIAGEEDSYLGWAWTELKSGQNIIVNESDGFNFIKINSLDELSLKFDFIEIEAVGLDDNELKGSISLTGLIPLPYPFLIISKNKEDNRLTIDGETSTDYEIIGDSEHIKIKGIDVFAFEQFEFVAFNNVVYQ